MHFELNTVLCLEGTLSEGGELACSMLDATPDEAQARRWAGMKAGDGRVRLIAPVCFDAYTVDEFETKEETK